MINPFALDDEEAALVAEALYETLTTTRLQQAESLPTDIDIAGEWDIVIDFANGPAEHRLILRHLGDALSGVHQTPYGEGEALGAMTAPGFDVQVFHMVEGCFVGFRFVADHCVPDRVSGFVELGTASDHAIGPTTLGQFGRLPFNGRGPSDAR